MEKMLTPRLPIRSFEDLLFQKEEGGIQLDCPKKLKEELKILWASAVLSDLHLIDPSSFKVRALNCLQSPFSKSSPIIEVLIYLLAKKIGRLTPPLIPRYAFLPLFELCQLALLWSIAGFSREASCLAHSISSFLDFPTLWCREDEYDEEEAAFSLALFRSENISKKNLSPFFLAMSTLFSSFDIPCSITSFSPAPLFFHSAQIQGVLTLLGIGTSLGAFRANEIEVRAFAPHAAPLNELKGFGIERVLEGEDRWTRSIGFPGVWLEVKDFFENGLDIRFLGLDVDSSLHFSFYVKAPRAQIGMACFTPKSLNRYRGESAPVFFGEKLQIESLLPTKMELIPLAGEGCFWNTDFLLSFEIHPVEARVLFKWSFLE